MKFKNNDVLCHIKSGGMYTVVGTPEFYRIESTGEPAYAYTAMWGRNVGVIWIRGQQEMEDGRFVLQSRTRALTRVKGS